MRRFFAAPENFSEKEVVLNREEAKHLRDVLRLRTGETVSVFDGAGNEFLCSIEKIEREKSVLAVLEKIAAPAPESELNLTLAIALLKGEKFDLVVQKATELGAKRIVPLQTKRADARLSEKDFDKKLERWRRIALEAAKQSGRAFIPAIETPIQFEAFAENNTGILFAERGGANLHQSLEMCGENLTAIVGAEGGWDAAEIETVRKKDFQIVTLGGRILRAETAAITVVALLQHLRGDLH